MRFCFWCILSGVLVHAEAANPKRECYVCNSLVDDHCQDGTFDKHKVPSLKCNATLSKGKSIPFKGCRKYVQEANPRPTVEEDQEHCGNGTQNAKGYANVFCWEVISVKDTPRIQRGCAYNYDAKVDGVKRVGNEGVRTTEYVCFDELCNNAPATPLHCFMTVLVFIVGNNLL